MLENVFPREQLRGLARTRFRTYEAKSVAKNLVEVSLISGWSLEKQNLQSARLRRPKSAHEHLRDRAWSLFYRSGLTHLSSAAGASLLLRARDLPAESKTLEIVALDDEIGIYVSCVAEQQSKSNKLADLIEAQAALRSRFSSAVNNGPLFAGKKRQVVPAIFTARVVISREDRERARQSHVILFDEQDISYYENLVAHLGHAARYQLFADMLPGKPIPGLELRLPAIRLKIGKTICYSFSIAPDYLLKIAYISHRSKGKASDVHTYQRMLSRQRLKKIKEYIENDGVFPTNIVVNIDKGRAVFDRIQQEDQDNGTLGWLQIRPAYKSAWVIDGQHRLFAYSGHHYAKTSRLTVLAFEGLEASKQAGLFIDINAKQKSVKQSLLQELYAELHWDATDPEKRQRAIISKALQVLDSDLDSPIYRRIQTSDAPRTDLCCISLTSLFSAIERADFLVKGEGKGKQQFGLFWAESADESLERTVLILRAWLGAIRETASDWWDLGAGEGGGLAMNDGVTACVNVLRSVVQFETEQDGEFPNLNAVKLAESLRKYGVALGTYFASLSGEQRRAFRDLRGVQGQTRRTRMCQLAIRNTFPTFNPAGLDDFLRNEKAQTNARAKDVVDEMETILHDVIVERLQGEFTDHPEDWLAIGVPQSVRVEVSKRYEEDDRKRGGLDRYFDLIHYRKIALENWLLFESILSIETSTGRSKEKRTEWLVFVNDQRKIVAHATSGRTVPGEDLERLQRYLAALKLRVNSLEAEDNESADRDED